MKKRSKSILSWLLSICIALAAFAPIAVIPASTRAESFAVEVDQDWFDSASSDVFLEDSETYQLTENIVIGQNVGIHSYGENTRINLNGHKITVASEKYLYIGQGISVTGAVYQSVYADDSAALDINGGLTLDNASIDVSGDSGIGIKVNPGGFALLGTAYVEAPDIGLYCAGGDAMINGRTSITAGEDTGTAMKVDNGGSAYIFYYETIDAAVRFDRSGGTGHIYNYFDLLGITKEDGSQMPWPVPRGTVSDFQYQGYMDGPAMDAAGTPLYYTLDGSVPTPADVSEGSSTKRLDNDNLSDLITIDGDTPVRTLVYLADWPEPAIEIHNFTFPTVEPEEPVHEYSDFIEEFNNIKDQGGVINLTGNLTIDEGTVLTSSREIIINTGGYRVIVDGEDSALTLRGKVRITGEGQDSELNPGVVAAMNGGRFEMQGGEVEATEPGGTAVYVSGAGAVIQGGTVRTDAADGTGVFVGEWGRADISGGKIITDEDTGTGVKAEGENAEAVISGGVITAHTPKLKGNGGNNNEKIYDFRGIDIFTDPSPGYVSEGTSVTISKRLLSGDLDPMDAVYAAVYYTTDDSPPTESDNPERVELTGDTSQVVIDTHKTINIAAMVDEDRGVHGAVAGFTYIINTPESINGVVASLRSITGYEWAYDPMEQLFRSFILAELNPTAAWVGGPVTRARLAKLISLGFRLPYYASVRISFPGDWEWAEEKENEGFVPYIEMEKDYFVYNEDTFAPAAPVTREQLVYAIIKVLGLNKDSLQAEDTVNAANKYSKDWDAVDNVYKPYVALATKLGFVSGFNGYFKPEAPVSNAEMSVLLWRALNSSGGVGKGLFSDMKTGDYGYEAVMDLVNRAGDAFSGQTEFNPNDMVDGSTWNIWKAALGVGLAYPGDGTTKRLEAAILLIAELPEDSKKEGQVFSDVAPTDGCYDGVMNLYNAGIIKGYEDGTFRPDEELTANSLANFVAQQKGIPVIDWQNAVNQEDICAYFPGTPADNTREAAAYAILKLLDVDTSAIGGDTADAILGGFADKDGISAACKPAMAYMISIGALKGDENGRLNPKDKLSRGQFAVFYSRVLNGLDKSKMKDYMDIIDTAE